MKKMKVKRHRKKIKDEIEKNKREKLIQILKENY